MPLQIFLYLNLDPQMEENTPGFILCIIQIPNPRVSRGNNRDNRDEDPHQMTATAILIPTMVPNRKEFSFFPSFTTGNTLSVLEFGLLLLFCHAEKGSDMISDFDLRLIRFYRYHRGLSSANDLLQWKPNEVH